jgi:MoxR-like ATPase
VGGFRIFGEGAVMADMEMLRGRIQAARAELCKVFMGKDEPVDLMLLGFIAGLPVLIEDIPGVGKTTLARALAAACDLDFGRIQFTPDLLPGDITGMTVWSQETRGFVFKPGAIMRRFVLADEINRAPARTQAALLEAMQEGAVTVDGVTHRLPEPFFLVATQNPLSYAGTFQLPEAQLDRFGIGFAIGYPERADEMRIGRMISRADVFGDVAAVLAADDIVAIRDAVRAVLVDDQVLEYVVRIVAETRGADGLRTGASPRAGQHLARAAQARAFLDGRGYVMPEDVRAMSRPVLAHRLSLSPEARLAGRQVRDILAASVQRIAMPSGLR